MSRLRTTAAPETSAGPAAQPYVPPAVILAIACVANFMVIIDTSTGPASTCPARSP